MKTRVLSVLYKSGVEKTYTVDFTYRNIGQELDNMFPVGGNVTTLNYTDQSIRIYMDSVACVSMKEHEE